VDPLRIVVALHVLSVFALVAGMFGRTFAGRQAARETDVKLLASQVALANRFEARMLRPGSWLVLITGFAIAGRAHIPILGTRWLLISIITYLTIIPLIVLVFVPRAKALQTVLAQAATEGRVTPGLRAAVNDPVINAARVYELFLVAFITFLMVVKPF
jgi:hypothetical protein